MPNPNQLRDSTQIVLPQAAVDGLSVDLEDEFVVSVIAEDDEHYRIVGSPVEIKDASSFLARNGVAMP